MTNFRVTYFDVDGGRAEPIRIALHSAGSPIEDHRISVQEFGGGDMLEVGRRRGRTILVPFTRDIVPVVDMPARRITVDPPEGLLDDPEKGGPEKEERDDD